MFPISNWTELDIWQYVAEEGIELPSIYFAHTRRVFQRDGMWLADTPFVTIGDDEEVEERMVRFRTVGDTSCTGAIESPAADVSTIIEETAVTRVTERGHPRRRSHQRGRHGRPQEGGVLLDGAAAFYNRRECRRRQVHADRPVALHSKAIFEDQLESVERAGRERGDVHTDLALLTDGLRAEREQGITIDVAYRYFATPRRKFIIADTPGHVQYTRNMVTGASTADLALVLVDARKGVLEQSRRHAFLASLLGIPHLVVCVNKMDLVDWSQERYDEIKAEFRSFAMKLDVHDLTFVPSRRCTATTWSSGRPTCRGTRVRRCCTSSKRCTSPATATSSTPASRCSTSSARRTRSTTTCTTTAATPARWPAGCSSRATRWSSCPRA